MRALRNNIRVISSKAPFCKAFKTVAVLFLVFTSTSCAFISRQLHSTFNFYSTESPFELTEYNPITDEKPRLKLKNYEDIDLKVSTEEFYIRKTFKLTDFYLDSGKVFKESEARRDRDKYLTLR